MVSRLIYFCSEFPGISHTFIFREIEILKHSGFEISTVSVNRPYHLEKMTGPEKLLAAGTVYLKKTPPGETLRILSLLCMKMPVKMIRMLRAAVSLAMLKGPRSPRKALGYFVEAALLVNEATQRNVRHIHVHFANPAATVALIASCSGTVDYSVSVHGPDVFYDIETNLLKEKVAAATFVRCISHYCRSQLCRLIPHETWPKLRIIRCGVDPGIFSPRPAPHSQIPHLVCVGRLTRNKGQHILIEACSRLKEIGTGFHLTFAGDGEDRASLEHHVSALGLGEEITFAGAMGQENVKALYTSADMFILPSFAEGVPVVLMEAMAMEIPVISTCITGIPELIESGNTGFLTAPGDAETLCAKIKLLLDEPLLRTRLGKQGREKVTADYNLANNCRLLADVFREVLQGK